MNKGGTPENLKPFKKGKSGNPKGRPKLPDLAEALEEVIGADGVRDMLKAMLAKAKKGSEKATEIVLDRMYGKSKQSIDLNANVKGDVTIERHVNKRDED